MTMRYWRRCVPQPLIGLVASFFALVVLIGSWPQVPQVMAQLEAIQFLLTAVFLIAAIACTHLYPIHLRPSTKIVMASVPLYLAAVLLPPSIAAFTAGLGWLLGQLSTRKKYRLLPIDIMTGTSRWIILSYLAANVAHWAVAGEMMKILLLPATALVMYVGDLLTSALEIIPMTGEPALSTIAAMIREGAAIEGVQYLIGILGALAAFQQPWAVLLLVLPTAIVYAAFKNLREMRDGTRSLLESMADSVDLRDPSTGGHSRRVAELCHDILGELHLWGLEAELIVAAARVHDIGKMDLPDHILAKPGPLTPDEWKIMKQHTEQGAVLLARYPDFKRGADFIRYHHERWDGAGYPRGLKGFDIPLGARVIAVADAFDAMISDRPYRDKLTSEQAIVRMRADQGHQWDPSVVEALLQHLYHSEKIPRAVSSVAEPLLAPTLD